MRRTEHSLYLSDNNRLNCNDVPNMFTYGTFSIIRNRCRSDLDCLHISRLLLAYYRLLPWFEVPLGSVLATAVVCLRTLLSSRSAAPLPVAVFFSPRCYS